MQIICDIEKFDIEIFYVDVLGCKLACKFMFQDPCAINYGVVIENFPAGEVGAIVLDFSDHLVYKVPMSFFESKEDRFKLGDNVIFCLAPKSNIIAHCERNRNFFANNNSIQVEKSITVIFK